MPFSWDELDAKRQAVQSRRIVSDETLLPLFVDPLRLHDLGEDYERLAGELFAEFGLDGLARTEAIGAKSGPTNSTGAARNGVGDGRDARMAGGDVREIRVEAGQTRPVVSIVILTALGPTSSPRVPGLADRLAISGRTTRGHRGRQRLTGGP